MRDVPATGTTRNRYPNLFDASVEKPSAGWSRVRRRGAFGDAVAVAAVTQPVPPRVVGRDATGRLTSQRSGADQPRTIVNRRVFVDATGSVGSAALIFST